MERIIVQNYTDNYSINIDIHIEQHIYMVLRHILIVTIKQDVRKSYRMYRMVDWSIVSKSGSTTVHDTRLYNLTEIYT